MNHNHRFFRLPPVLTLLALGLVSSNAWAETESTGPVAAASAPTPSAAAESIEVVQAPFKVSGLTVTPLPVTYNRILAGGGLGVAKSGDEYLVSMPAYVAYERRIGQRVFLRAMGSLDLGALLLQSAGGYQFLDLAGMEVMGGYALSGHNSTVSGMWALSAEEFRESPLRRTLKVQALGMSLPARSHFIVEGGVRRNIPGLVSQQLPESGSFTLVAGIRSLDIYRARLDALNQETDGTGYWFAHALLGAIGGSERTVKSVGGPPSPVGFELGWAGPYWISAKVNFEVSAGLSPALGWFGYFGFSNRVISW
jgi:hypothetical protein